MTTLIRLKDLAEQEHPNYLAEAWTVVYRVCAICGFASWRSAKDKGLGFKVEIDNSYPEWDCPRCVEVAGRAPEVMRWVLSVIQHQLEKRDA